jgi:hypothetical protein
MEARPISVGTTLRGARGRPIGTVDAVFVDYLLVRTRGLLPVDLYVPRDALVGDDGPAVECTPAEAYRRWHRPLKRAPHPD